MPLAVENTCTVRGKNILSHADFVRLPTDKKLPVYNFIMGQAHQPWWSFNQLLVLLAVWAGAKSCWKMKSASLKSWSTEGSMKCSKRSW